MPQFPPNGLWPLVTQHRNSRVCRSDAERMQTVWRSSSLGCPRDRSAAAQIFGRLHAANGGTLSGFFDVFAWREPGQVGFLRGEGRARPDADRTAWCGCLPGGVGADLAATLGRASHCGTALKRGTVNEDQQRADLDHAHRQPAPARGPGRPPRPSRGPGGGAGNGPAPAGGGRRYR